MFLYYDKNSMSVKKIHPIASMYDDLDFVEVNNFDSNNLKSYNVRINSLNPVVVEYMLKSDLELNVVKSEELQTEQNVDFDYRLSLIEMGLV